MRWLIFFLLLVHLVWAEDVPVRLNEVITLDMAIDTGASRVCLPDGSGRKDQMFILRKLRNILERVPATVSGKGGSLLLGQSALVERSQDIVNLKVRKLILR